MLQYIINVTDNSFVFIVIISFIYNLFSSQLNIKKNSFVLSFVFGFIFSFLYAILKKNTGFMVREYYDLIFYFLWLITIIPLIFISCATYFEKKQLKKSNYSTIFLIFNLGAIFSLLIPNILLFPFEFSVAMDSILNNHYLSKWAGYAVAIILIFLFFISLSQILKKFSLVILFIISHLALLIFSILSIIKILQILTVRRILPVNKWLIDVIIFFSGHANLFCFIFLGICFLLAIILFIKSKLVSIAFKNPAQRRKITADLRKDRRACLRVILGIVITGFIVTKLRDLEESGIEISEADPVFSNGGSILIPILKVNDGNLHRFSYETTDKTIVRFIVIKKNEHSFGVGLDACDICGVAGYYQRGSQVVCSRCDVVMNIATIGLSGGCNPVPLTYEIVNEHLCIKAIHLESEKNRFK